MVLSRKSARALIPLLLSLGLGLTAVAVPSRLALAAEKKSDKSDSKDKAAQGEEKPFDEVVKGMEVVKGYFTFYRKPDENKVLMEILPSQLDSIFLFAPTLEQGIGERGLYSAMLPGDFPFCLPVYFHRSGKLVEWIQKNTRFTADPGTPEARALSRSFANSILASAKIQSLPHPERKSLLIDASDLLAQQDLLGFGIAINQIYKPTSYTFDKDRSAITGVKGFDESVLIDITLHFTTDNPKAVSLTLPDARSLPVGLKYQLSALRKTDYRPRAEDDRVGYYHTVTQDFTSDHPTTPYVRHIFRWNLEKSDPSAPLSSPKQPIVFWLENTIPTEYRETVTKGVLLWNKAFERIGFKDAIVVKQQPDDATWDPADTRYNTIRWFQGIDATFAIGPSRQDPFTGEIYDADIGVSEGIIRYTRRAGEEFVDAVRLEDDENLPIPGAWSGRPSCTYGAGMAHQLALGMSVLETRGEATPELTERLMREYIVELVAHEVGHTLGLRHNFRGSILLPPSELDDDAKTEQIGQSASVMDYNPIVIAAKGMPQGHFVPVTLGPYDYWAIEYGYKPIQGGETEELGKIAARGGSDPTLPYSTDEDAADVLPGVSMDPLATRFDASSDPIAWSKLRVGIVKELWSGLDTTLARPGEGYQVMRRAAIRGLNDYARAVLIASRFVGGIYHHRDHVGDPGGRLPYTVVPALKQKEALDFLAADAFGDRAFLIPAETQRRLAVERTEPIDWFHYYRQVRLDFPWHDAVLGIQRMALNRVLSPITLGRIQDNELRFEPTEKPFHMADLFASLDGAVWSELDRGKREIPSLRRNLQREYVKRLIKMALREDAAGGSSEQWNPESPPPMPPLPEDATTLARASLARLQGKIRRALLLKAPMDATTRAHLVETRSRISAALDSKLERSTD